jgi:hypothetical protein
MKEKHVAIINNVGQTVIGKVVTETGTTLTLANPITLFITIEEGGRIKMDMYPVLFFEFIDKDNRDKNEWTYQKSAITTSNVVLDERIISQYTLINTPRVDPQPQNNPKVISIEDL